MPENLVIEVATGEKLERIEADILADNAGMQRICETLGFRLEPSSDGGTVHAEIRL